VKRRVCIILVAAIVAGCSGIKSYPDGPNKNVNIRTVTKSGSILSTVGVALHIHRANAKCETEYVGTVQLSKPLIQVAIPPGELSYLVLSFNNSSLLGSSSSTMRYETLLRPRAGHSYDIKVSYVDDFYDVAIREIDPRRSSGRDVRRLSLNACGSQPG
jgi:hypothetical protein